MHFEKASFEDTLQGKVVSKGRCFGCFACVITCPYASLDFVDGKPYLEKECKICGICSQICPQYESQLSQIEGFVFGRQRKHEEDFGIHRRIVVARAEDDEILRVCQDGGVVTALLLNALNAGLIDSAVVSCINERKPFYPVPKVVTTSEDLLACAGTRYSYSPNLLALAEAVKNHSSVAFVGTPCQILALRRIQLAGLKKYALRLKFLIGLMCSESFAYEGLMESYIQKKLGVNLADVKKINIKGKMILTLRNDLVQTIPLKELKQYSRESCGFCGDFSSELADVSAGGLGLNGWTFAVIRTEKGEELFSSAEKAGIIKTRSVNEEPSALSLLRKLSQKKRERLSSLLESDNRDQ
ncbi:MAG: Coenzyme F420 hydrogenase/dehydrogenase, beta subunit C-terminal domain [Candidatus Bathycorpusculaceae bacterium]